jgi:predicted transcriptional regulator
MTIAQNSITKTFIDSVKFLKERGDVKSFNELADVLKWNRTSMSNVLNGRINVPHEVYKKFADRFNTDHLATIKDAPSFTTKAIIKNEAMLRVILSAVAEMLATQRGVPVATMMASLESTVAQEIESRIKKMKSDK